MKEKIFNLIDLLCDRCNCDLRILDVSEIRKNYRSLCVTKDKSTILIKYPTVFSENCEITVQYHYPFSVTAEEYYSFMSKITKIILNYNNDLLDIITQEISEN